MNKIKDQINKQANALLNVVCIFGITWMAVTAMLLESWFLGFCTILAIGAFAVVVYFQQYFVSETMYGDWDDE